MGLFSNPGVMENPRGQRTVMLLGDHENPWTPGGLLLPAKDMEEDGSQLQAYLVFPPASAS